MSANHQLRYPTTVYRRDSLGGHKTSGAPFRGLSDRRNGKKSTPSPPGGSCADFSVFNILQKSTSEANLISGGRGGGYKRRTLTGDPDFLFNSCTDTPTNGGKRLLTRKNSIWGRADPTHSFRALSKLSAFAARGRLRIGFLVATV